MNRGEKRLLAGEASNVGRVAEDAQDTVVAEREDFRLPARVDEGVRADAEFSKDVGGKLPDRGRLS